MSNKKKDKVPKSGKTRLSDMTPQKQPRGGAAAPAQTPPGQVPPPQKGITLPPF